jgi:glucokinase
MMPSPTNPTFEIGFIVTPFTCSPPRSAPLIIFSMLLAADVGGTKTLVGLFRPEGRRPVPVATRVYATTDFHRLDDVVRTFVADTGSPRVDAFAAGIAGPVTGSLAQLTNVDMRVDAIAIAAELGGCPAWLLNDLEAMALSVAVLESHELLPLHAPNSRGVGNGALIAAGTGLGESELHLVEGRWIPAASEGGHADFAARTPRELALVAYLAKIFGRVEVERVISGMGIANLFRFTHEDRPCDAIAASVPEHELPAAVSEAALAGTCPRCAEALEMFVSAYGAEAGNLALRSLALGGVYVGGGIAVKILPALTNGVFMDAFLDKAPMRHLLSGIHVNVILNEQAVLIGASVRAAALAESAPR